MGEKSKTIGEIGENIAQNFFALLGWHELLPGQSLTCAKKQKHASKESKKGLRETHGIDYLFSYKSSLEANRLENVLISVKHTAESYPNSPRLKFQEHATDLVQTLECFKRSTLSSDQKNKFSNINSSRDSGVLFWISSHDETYDNLVSKIEGMNFDFDANFEIFHVVDNNQIHFIFKTLNALKNKFKTQEILFYYPETVMSYEDSSIRRHGKIFPVEFITAPVIPFYIKNTGDDASALDTICIASKDDFDEDSVRRLAKAAMEYTGETGINYLFIYPNYSAVQHKVAFKKALVGLGDQIIERSNIIPFNSDFRSLANDE